MSPNQISGISSSADTGLLFSETGGAWGAGSVPQLPTNADQAAPPSVGAISCSTSNGCTAAGTYDAATGASVATADAAGSAATGGGREPYVVRHTSAGWSRAIELTPPVPTRAQILVGIRTLLAADRQGASAARGHTRFTSAVRAFTALEAGTITIRWTAKAGRRNVLVARVAARVTKPITIKLHIRVTKAGASLLRTSRTLRVTDQVVFTPVASAAVRASDSFKLAAHRFG